MFGASLSSDSVFTPDAVPGGEVGAAFGADGSYSLSTDVPRNTDLWGTSRAVEQEQRIQGQREYRQIRQIDRHMTTQERTPGGYR